MKHMMKAMVLAVTVMAGYGQEHYARFRVDFPFQVGKTLMPAGEYRIQAESAGRHWLRITSVNNGPAAVLSLPVHDTARASDDKRQVEFRCEGDLCMVARVVNLQAGYISSLPKSKSSNSRLVTALLTKRSTKTE